MDMPLSGKSFVVTGATSGIGLAACHQLARQGAFVIGVGRSLPRCQQAERQVRASSPAGSSIAAGSSTAAGACFLVADLSLQSQVRGLAQAVTQTLAAAGRSSLDGLINNAGAFTYWLSLTAEGFETQWAVNHLAPFLLTHELLPLLQAAPSARVVTVSSASHYGAHLRWDDLQLRRRYFGLTAYGSTKLANVLFTLELNRRLGQQSSVRAFAADPGLVKTDMGFKGTPAIARWVWKIRRSGGITPEDSARGIVFLATDPGIQDSPHIYWKHSQPKTPSREALKLPSAARLWEISAQMCDLTGEAA